MDNEWHDWTFNPPSMHGLRWVEAKRNDGLYGWDRPVLIEVSRDPLLNVAGLFWRKPTVLAPDTP